MEKKKIKGSVQAASVANVSVANEEYYSHTSFCGAVKRNTPELGTLVNKTLSEVGLVFQMRLRNSAMVVMRVWESETINLKIKNVGICYSESDVSKVSRSIRKSAIKSHKPSRFILYQP